MATVTAGPALASAGLYGEPHDLPDIVHCETIASRSRLHEWELAPHHHLRLHQVLVVERGGGTATIDGARHPLTDRCSLNIPARMVHAFSFRPGTDGYVMTLAVELVDDTLRHDGHLRAALGRPGLIPAGAGLRRAAAGLLDGHDRIPDPARSLELRSLCGVVLALVARGLLQGEGPEAPVADDRLVRFQELLEEHLADHWSVAAYAAAVGVSPTHLSRLTTAATGRSASRLITDRLLLEARRELAYTDLPVTTIARTLGFADPAYFSRVFKRVVGVPPRTFRARVNQVEPPDRDGARSADQDGPAAATGAQAGQGETGQHHR